jgi:hypothetical protein
MPKGHPRPTAPPRLLGPSHPADEEMKQPGTGDSTSQQMICFKVDMNTKKLYESH